MSNDQKIKDRLGEIYEEVMWLAHRSHVSPSAARAWYTHVASNSIKRYIRMFSGKVSLLALNPDETLRLEHFKRMQTTLTKLVDRHVLKGAYDKNEFIRAVLDCEQVHIVTLQENYAAMKADGNYQKAGISLVAWSSIPSEQKVFLWRKMLRGKVANADKFKPDE